MLLIRHRDPDVSEDEDDVEGAGPLEEEEAFYPDSSKWEAAAAAAAVVAAEEEKVTRAPPRRAAITEKVTGQSCLFTGRVKQLRHQTFSGRSTRRPAWTPCCRPTTAPPSGPRSAGRTSTSRTPS